MIANAFDTLYLYEIGSSNAMVLRETSDMRHLKFILRDDNTITTLTTQIRNTLTPMQYSPTVVLEPVTLEVNLLKLNRREKFTR